MLLDAAVVPEVSEILTGAEFYDTTKRRIYRAIIATWEEKGVTDPLLVAERLIGDIQNPAVLLHQAMEACAVASHAASYARQVRDAYRRRRLEELALRIQDDLRAGKALEEISEATLDELTRLSAPSAREVIQTPTELLRELHVALEEGEGELTDTGLPSLDAYLDGGLRPGNLFLAAGRPGCGKTAFLVTLIHHIALRRGKGLLFASLEMSTLEIAQRLAAQVLGWSLANLRKQLSDDEFRQVVERTAKLADAKLYVVDRPVSRVGQLRTLARNLAARGGLSCVVVDYLQLMDDPRYERRNEQIASVSRELKLLARDLRVAVVAACQLNRESEYRRDRMPTLADLRDSGALEQDADYVLALWRDKDGLARADLLKNRHGPQGSLNLEFHPATVSWRERPSFTWGRA